MLNFEKPEDFDGNDFETWQKKMLSCLHTLSLAYIILEQDPLVKEEEEDAEKLKSINMWKRDEYLCRNYILNSMTKNLSNLYTEIPSAKELWYHLEKRYIKDSSNNESDAKDWLVITSSARHVCADRGAFSTYEPVRDGEVVYTANNSAVPVAGKGRIELKFTSGKILILKEVLHVPNYLHNIVSVPLLCDEGFAIQFGKGKVVLSKKGVFWEEGYLSDGLFKLNVTVGHK